MAAPKISWRRLLILIMLFTVLLCSSWRLWKNKTQKAQFTARIEQSHPAFLLGCLAKHDWKIWLTSLGTRATYTARKSWDSRDTSPFEYHSADTSPERSAAFYFSHQSVSDPGKAAGLQLHDHLREHSGGLQTNILHTVTVCLRNQETSEAQSTVKTLECRVTHH